MELTDKNLYAYCDNNPIMREDDGGEFWHIVAGAVIGAAISATITIASNLIKGESITDGLLTATLSGAASGALSATGIGIVGAIAGNAAISMGENMINQITDNGGFEDFDVADMVTDGIIDSNKDLSEKWIQELLEKTDIDNPQRLADVIIQESVDNTYGIAKDDMTVVVSQFKINE